MARLLVVDDAAFMRMTLQKMFEGHGHKVVAEASNGMEAVQKYVDSKPDVVFMDISMPDMNGIEALKRIKAVDPKAKVVICSAMGQQAMLADAIQYGAMDFVVKPFQEERLIAALNKVLTINH